MHPGFHFSSFAFLGRYRGDGLSARVALPSPEGPLELILNMLELYLHRW